MSEIVDMLRSSADDMERNQGIAQRFNPHLLRRLACRIDNTMAELPRDKDGKPIRVGDTVYGEDGREWHVCGVTIGESPASWEDHDVHVTNDSNEFESFGSMQLTHERPNSWERIADELDEMVDAADSADDRCEKLADIAERIRKLAKNEDER
jgi:hypothetical protein